MIKPFYYGVIFFLNNYMKYVVPHEVLGYLFGIIKIYLNRYVSFTIVNLALLLLDFSSYKVCLLETIFGKE